MASRYWVAGGTGNVSSTTNWSTSSGGASGASKPGSGDDVIVDSASGTGAITVDETTTWATLSVTGRAVYDTITLAANLTVSGNVTMTANNSSTQRLWVGSGTTGTARTFTCNGTVSIQDVDFEDITGAGSGTWSGTRIGNCGGNSGITAATPATCYWVHDGTASHPITDALWFTTSGGAVATRMPLPQDTALFDSGSFGSSGKTVTIGTASFRLPTISFSGATNSPTFNLNSSGPKFYGSLTLVSGLTFSQTGIANFVGRGSYTITNAGKSFSGAQVNINAYGGTYTLQDAMSVPGSYFVLTRGTFADGGFSVSAYGLSGSGSNTRALTISGTWTMAGSSSPLDLSGSNITVTATNSTFVFTDASSATKSISGGGNTLYNLTLSGSGSGAYSVSGSGTTWAGTTTVSNTGGASVDLFASSSMTHKNIVFTGATVTWAGSTAGTISGSLALASGVTLTHTGGLTFSATTTATITSAGKTIAEALTFNGVGGTWTLQDVATWTAATTLTNGTLAFSTFNSSILSLSSSNSNTRTINLGSGTLTLTGTGTVWNCATSTNLTVTNNNGTIKINDASSSSKTFSGGGKTYANIWLTGAGTGTFDFVGSNTFTDFKCDTPPHTIRFTAGTTTTAASWTLHGNTASHITITSITSASHTLATTSAGPIVCTYLTISYSTATGATFYARASTNSGNNSGWIFTDALTMAPRLSFNSRTIDFAMNPFLVETDMPRTVLRNTSASGLVETLNVRQDVMVHLLIEAFRRGDATDDAVKRKLQQWLSWAQAGNSWSFARDASRTVLTSLSAGAAAGATTISLSSTAGIVEGEQYILRGLTDVELVKVSSVGAGSVVVAEPISFDFASGDRFRSERYWPARLMDNRNPIIEQPTYGWSFDLVFREDVNDL